MLIDWRHNCVNGEWAWLADVSLQDGLIAVVIDKSDGHPTEYMIGGFRRELYFEPSNPVKFLTLEQAKREAIAFTLSLL